MKARAIVVPAADAEMTRWALLTQLAMCAGLPRPLRPGEPLADVRQERDSRRTHNNVEFVFSDVTQALPERKLPGGRVAFLLTDKGGELQARIGRTRVGAFRLDAGGTQLSGRGYYKYPAGVDVNVARVVGAKWAGVALSVATAAATAAYYLM